MPATRDNQGFHAADATRKAGDIPTPSEIQPERETICGYKVHPAAAQFPPLTGADYEQMIESIRIRGQLQPVIINGTELLEGCNRARCVEQLQREGHAIDLKAVQWSPATPGETPAEYVMSVNLHRRHLTDAQRVQIAAELVPMIEQEQAASQAAGRIQPGDVRNPAGRNQHSAGRKADAVSIPPSSRKAQNKKKVSRSTVGKVAAMAKTTAYAAAQAVKIRKQARPEDVEAIKAGIKKPSEVSKTLHRQPVSISFGPLDQYRRHVKHETNPHPFVPRDDFEAKALMMWQGLFALQRKGHFADADRPRLREVLSAVFEAEKEMEQK